jgi:hypothetical protein
MNGLVDQMNVIAASVELVIWVAGIVFAFVAIRLVIDLVKGK